MVKRILAAGVMAGWIISVGFVSAASAAPAVQKQFVLDKDGVYRLNDCTVKIFPDFEVSCGPINGVVVYSYDIKATDTRVPLSKMIKVKQDINALAGKTYLELQVPDQPVRFVQGTSLAEDGGIEITAGFINPDGTDNTTVMAGSGMLRINPVFRAFFSQRLKTGEIRKGQLPENTPEQNADLNAIGYPLWGAGDSLTLIYPDSKQGLTLEGKENNSINFMDRRGVSDNHLRMSIYPAAAGGKLHWIIRPVFSMQ